MDLDSTSRRASYQSPRQLSSSFEYRKCSYLATGSNTLKSRSIPISRGVDRTSSELQSLQDEEIADFRDYVVFSRIVNGINSQQKSSSNFLLRAENSRSLANVLATRNDQMREPNHESVGLEVSNFMNSQNSQRDCGWPQESEGHEEIFDFDL